MTGKNKGYPISTGIKTWKELEQLRNHGYSYFFNDWLDLILNSLLSMTENYQSAFLKQDLAELNQGKYNERYMQIVKKYSAGKTGERAIDHLANAFKFLIQETQETGKDVIGEIFQNQITYGENSQFFTPEHVSDFMAKMLVPNKEEIVGTNESESDMGTQTLMDPCCGSGRFILSSAKENDYYFIGQDIDERCCKMTAINMFIRDLNGEVRWGNSLINKIQKRWIIKKGGFIFEDDQEREFEKEVFSKQEQTKGECVLNPRTEIQKTLW